jgi:tripartite-type tricarboxylate transporter receptor subunit TctC
VNRQHRRLIGIGLLLASWSATAYAQDYPQRPVRVVVGVAAGSTGDVVARAVADGLSARLKQPFVIENRTGAAGNLAAESVAKAAADGHALLVTVGSTLTVNPAVYRTLPFDPEADLRPISILTTSSTMLVVHPSIPARSVAEFVTYARQEPIAYATGGNGTPSHLSMELFRQKAGFRATPVPYRGNGPLATDLVAGQIKVSFPAIGSVIAHVGAGRLRALAVSGGKRDALAPQVPTMAEAGYPDVRLETQMVLSAPAALPDAVVALLEREVRTVLKQPGLDEKLRAHGYEIAASGSEEARALLRAERSLWRSVVTAAGIKVQ